MYFLFNLSGVAFECGKLSRKNGNRIIELHSQGRRHEITPDTKWMIKPIGICRSPFKECFGTPRQATVNATVASQSINGTFDSSPAMMLGYIELFEGFGYEEALDALDGFSYVWIISYLHLTKPLVEDGNNKGWRSKVRPRRYTYSYSLLCFSILNMFFFNK
jgi:hypothetical protein